MLRRFLNPDDASEPESGGQMPDTQRLNIEDYHRILQESYGRIAADIAELRRSVGTAEDRHARLSVGALGMTYQIPTGPWRSVVVSRPSIFEMVAAANNYVQDLYLTFDKSFNVTVSFNGLTSWPYLGWDTVAVTSTNPSTPPPSGWSVDVFFTTRKYEVSSYGGY